MPFQSWPDFALIWAVPTFDPIPMSTPRSSIVGRGAKGPAPLGRLSMAGPTLDRPELRETLGARGSDLDDFSLFGADFVCGAAF